MAFLTMEDIYDTVEVLVFPEPFSRCEHIIDSPDPVIVQGTVQKDERGVKIKADAIYSLTEAREKFTESAQLKLEADRLSRPQLEKVKKTLYQYHGTCPILLTLHYPGMGEVDIEVTQDLTINPCRQLTDALEDILNYQAMVFTKKPIEVENRRKRWEKKPAN